MAGKGVGGTYDDKFHAGAGHGYVHAAQVAEKAYVAVVVAADKGDDDDVALLTLETIDGVDGNQVAEGFKKGSSLDESPEILHLCAIWRNKTYVNALVEKTLPPYLLYIVAKGQHGEECFVAVYPAMALSGETLTK